MRYWVQIGGMILVLLSLSACSLLGRSEGPEELPTLPATPDVARYWYCYGDTRREWHCQETPDPSRIVAIDPTRADAAPPPPMSLPEIRPPTPVEAPVTTVSAPAFPEQIAAQGGETILQQPGESFAVQLIALQEETGVLEYAKRHGLPDPLYAEIASAGGSWYVLLLGVFPDRESAEEARESWARTKTLKIQPWVRQLAPLQQAIRQAQES